MGKFMKFLYSFMLIVLVLLGALFLALGIDINSVGNFFIDAEFLNILISNEVFIKGFFISIGKVSLISSKIVFSVFNDFCSWSK